MTWRSRRSTMATACGSMVFLGDLRITLRDGSRLNLDFNKLADTGTFAQRRDLRRKRHRRAI